jgi:hypothetical protein
MDAAIVMGARGAADACSAVNGKEVARAAPHQEGRRVRCAHPADSGLALQRSTRARQLRDDAQPRSKKPRRTGVKYCRAASSTPRQRASVRSAASPFAVVRLVPA